MSPPEKLKVLFCVNDRGPGKRSCAASGAKTLRKDTKAACAGLAGIKIKNAGCLGHCKHGPILQLEPSGNVYRYDTAEDIAALLALPVDGHSVVASLLVRQGKGKKRKK